MDNTADSLVGFLSLDLIRFGNPLQLWYVNISDDAGLTMFSQWPGADLLIEWAFVLLIILYALPSYNIMILLAKVCGEMRI